MVGGYSGGGGGGRDQDQVNKHDAESRSRAPQEDPSAVGAGTGRAPAKQRVAVSQALLVSMAGDYWLSCRISLNLFPLKFRDKKREEDFVAETNQTHCLRLKPLALVLMFAVLVIWVTGGFSFAMGYAIQPRRIAVYFHLSSGVSLLTLVVLFLVPSLPKLRADAEFWYYATSLLNAFVYFTWCAYTTFITADMSDFTQLDTNPVAVVQFEKWSELRFITDGLTSALFVSITIITDCILSTISYKSIYVHILLLLMYTVNCIVPGTVTRRKMITTVNVLNCLWGAVFLIVAWASRWFRELQDRCVRVRVQESQSRLQAVRDAKKAHRRRSDQSAAEEILHMLNKCMEVVEKRRKGRAGGSLPQVADSLAATVQMIASGRDPQKAGAAGAALPGGVTGEEDAFINMFRTAGEHAGGAKALQQVAAGRTQVSRRSTLSSALGRKRVSSALDAEDQLPDGIGKDPALRMLDLGKKFRSILTDVGSQMTREFEGFLGISGEVVKGCFTVIERQHWNNPFHNALKAANTIHLGLAILHMMEISPACLQLEMVAFILAAAGQNIAHPGRTSAFYSKANHVLSLAYNDESVLETAHSVILYYLITSSPATNVFASMSELEEKAMRKLMVELILITDLSRHFEILSRSRIRRSGGEFNAKTNETDRQMIMQLVMKAADLGHTFLEWNQHLDWSFRQAEEFYQQGDDEYASQLTVSPLCNRKEHPNFPKIQLYFLQTFAMPLVEELAQADSTGAVSIECLARLMINRQKWDSLRESKKVDEIPSYIQELKIAPQKYITYVLHSALKAKSYEEVVHIPTLPQINRS